MKNCSDEFDRKLLEQHLSELKARSEEWDISTIGIITAANLVENAINGMLKDSGLTLSTISILSMLTESNGVLPQKELIRNFPFPITDQALTIALNNLEKLGYVRRSRMDGDKRTKLITLTNKGLLLAISSYEHRQAADAQLTVLFTPEETAAFRKTLDKYCKFFHSFRWEQTDDSFDGPAF